MQPRRPVEIQSARLNGVTTGNAGMSLPSLGNSSQSRSAPTHRRSSAPDVHNSVYPNGYQPRDGTSRHASAPVAIVSPAEADQLNTAQSTVDPFGSMNAAAGDAPHSMYGMATVGSAFDIAPTSLYGGALVRDDSQLSMGSSFGLDQYSHSGALARSGNLYAFGGQAMGRFATFNGGNSMAYGHLGDVSSSRSIHTASGAGATANRYGQSSCLNSSISFNGSNVQYGSGYGSAYVSGGARELESTASANSGQYYLTTCPTSARSADAGEDGFYDDEDTIITGMQGLQRTMDLLPSKWAYVTKYAEQLQVARHIKTLSQSTEGGPQSADVGDALEKLVVLDEDGNCMLEPTLSVLWRDGSLNVSSDDDDASDAEPCPPRNFPSAPLPSGKRDATVNAHQRMTRPPVNSQRRAQRQPLPTITQARGASASPASPQTSTSTHVSSHGRKATPTQTAHQPNAPARARPLQGPGAGARMAKADPVTRMNRNVTTYISFRCKHGPPSPQPNLEGPKVRRRPTRPPRESLFGVSLQMLRWVDSPRRANRSPGQGTTHTPATRPTSKPRRRNPHARPRQLRPTTQ